MLSNCFSKIDIIGPIPNLCVKTRSRYKTTFGGILSLLAIISTLVLSGYFTVTTLNRKTINIFFSDRKNTNPRFNIFDTFLMFTMVDANLQLHPNLISIITPKMLLREWIPSKAKMIEKSVPINSQCEKDYKNLWPNLAGMIDLPFSQICFDYNKTDLSKFELTQYGEPTGFSYASVQIFKCDNKTSSVECAPKEEIDNFLKHTSMGMKKINYAIENDNVANVITQYVENTVYGFSSSLYRRYETEFQSIEYTSDLGYVFEELDTKKFSVTGNTKTIIDLNSPIPGLIG